MIKKILLNFILIFFISLVIILIVLSTLGIETKKFNKLISSKINQTNKIQLELNTINFKLDPKKLSLFLETQKPKIEYLGISIPTQNVKVYIDFLPIFKTNLKIKRINLLLDEIDFVELKALSKFIKPSNFKKILNNKIKSGKIISQIDFFLNNQGKLDNYIIKGDVKNLKLDIFSNLFLTNTKFSFFADREDILIKNIFGNVDDIEIKNGDIKLNLENGVELNSNFNSNINLNTEKINKFNDLLKKFNLAVSIKELNGNFNNNILINFDKTYKVTNYIFKFSGKVKKSKIDLLKTIENNFDIGEINEIFLSDTQFDLDIDKNNLNLGVNGKYSLNNLDFLQLELNSNFRNDLIKINTNFDFKENFYLNLINYKKPKDKIAKVSIDFEKNQNRLNIKKFNFKEKNNFLSISNLKFRGNNFESLEKINIDTKNNSFSIEWDKKIMIKGNRFDATNLPKLLTQQGASNKFKKINTNIEIDFKNIKVPLSEKLENFRLIGKIKKGKFIKISSKGDFGGNNFLDISLKKDKESDRKFLEIYSDLTRPLLTEFSFFKGLTGGKLLFTSLIDGQKSNSKLKIENFKVVNAPGVIKLLSLADLGGLVDLAEGEGLTFDVLEIDMEKNKGILKLNEILALGPSMSVLIEGYQDDRGLTSLKGTLVPAKTLNKMISKIPVIGNIVIPKEVGEGLFGISFKMKGPKGDVKTTINPIRTLTPRFIQKIVEKNKVSK